MPLSEKNAKPKAKRKTLLSLLKNRIITGIFVVIPIFVSLWIAWWIYA